MMKQADELSETGSGAKEECEDGSVVEVVDQKIAESKPVKFIDQWCPRIKNGVLYVEGKLVGDSNGVLYGRLPYHTSRITRRLHGNLLVGCNGQQYGLEYQLVPGPGVNIWRYRS